MANESVGTSIYNYDNEYDEFSSSLQKQRDETIQKNKSQTEKGSSRYIAKLLGTAKNRNREREIIYERKLAREQQVENSKEEYVGKEKFVTKSYKRKLEERELWLKEEEERNKLEELNDVTKQKGLDSFYGNMMNRNVSMGGEGGRGSVCRATKKSSNDDHVDAHGRQVHTLDSSQMLSTESGHQKCYTFDRNQPKREKNRHEDTLNGNNVLSNDTPNTSYKYSTEDVAPLKSKHGNSNNPDHYSDPLMNEEKKKALHNASKLAARSEKLTAARERYFLRIEALKI